MKETLKKVFDKSVLAVVGVVFGTVIVFEYIVFPGLTTADSYTNILALLIGIISISFVYHFIQWKDLFNFLYEKKDDVVPPGETELDYISKDEVIKKKRTKSKRKPKTKEDGKVQ